MKNLRATAAWRRNILARSECGRALLQIEKLLETFDSLGDHSHAERASKGFDRAQDDLAARPLVNVADEGPVDFDFIRRDVRKRGQRRISRAEIVDRHANANLAQHR